MEEVKDYTVVFSNYFQSGSHRYSTTSYEYITCAKSNIKKEFEKHGFDITHVWFIFEGHCKPLKEW